MKRGLLLFFLLTSMHLFGQKGAVDLNTIERIDLPELNNAVLAQKEVEARKNKSRPLEFAQPCDVEANCHKKGNWTIEGNQAVWRLIVHSPGAKSLNFGFTEFYLPTSAEFDIIGLNSDQQQGPFIAADNDPHDQFWSPIIEDDEVLLEIKVNKDQKDFVRLNLSKVNHAYFKFGSKNFSGSCNLDVVCSAADGWGINDEYQDIIRSVIMYTLDGFRQCTGMLINNARSNGQPYIMTANHCEVSPGNASSFVAFYNFQNSTCREPGSTASGSSGNGTLSTFNTGATWISATSVGSGTDFNLLQLDDEINPNANAFISGWNRADAAPSSAIAIHHPNTEEKRISYEDDPLQISTNGGNAPNPNGRYLRVVDWDTGTTEPGSSGSPLFDPQKRFIGQLFGGDAACNNNSSDYYGRLAVSWEGGATSTTRVREYLDPDNIGMITVDGVEASATRYHSVPNAYLQEVCQTTDAVFTITTSANFTSTVTYSISDNPSGGNLTIQPTTANPGEMVTVTITNTAAIATGLYSLKILTSDENNHEAELPLWFSVNDGLPQDVTMLTPNDGATFQIPTPRLEWQSSGSNFDVQVATDNAFASLITSSTGVTGTSWLVDTELSPNAVYFWRVREVTACQAGNWSSTNQFTTGGVPGCGQFSSTDVPIDIEEPNASVIESSLNVSDPGQIASIKVTKIRGQHTFISDLAFTLISPSGTEVVLLANQCGSEDNFNIGFDDDSPLTIIPCPYANTSSYKPAQQLSAFKGEFANGTWKLRIADVVDADGGRLQEWSLEICTVENPNVSISAAVDTVRTCNNINETVSLTAGTGFSSTVSLTILSDIAGLNASLSQSTVAPGNSIDLNLSGDLTTNSTVVIQATDGNFTVTKNVYLEILPDPSKVSLISPANGAQQIPKSTILVWNQSGNTTMYRYQLATDDTFNNIVVEGTITDTTAMVSLAEDTPYFWRVASINNCDTVTSSSNSFRTASRFSYLINQDTIVTCQPAVEYQIILQSGFDGNVTAALVNNPAGSMVSYENNPGVIGDTIKVFLSGISTTASEYEMTITLTDATGMATIPLKLTIEESPDVPTLISPANNAGDIDTMPAFDFMLGTSTTTYRLEIATDLEFTNIIENLGTCGTCSTNISAPLTPNTIHYWRIAAVNSCGISFSPIYQFMTMVGVGIDDPFEAESISIEPNPANAGAEIVIETNSVINGQYSLMSIDGQVLKNGFIDSARTTLPTEGLAQGIYLVRIQDKSVFRIKKLIKL